MKKVLSLFLSIVMLFSTVACVDLSACAAEFSINNRAQWLSQLAKTFDMTVENDNYPDNYFSDLAEDSEYYYDVLLAVEFGVVDIEAGDPVNPEGEITREFAAQTLNACLKYELENADDENFTYTFTDFEQCEYPYDDQIAVNRGWLALDENKQFCPNQTVTSTEINIMLTDAQETLKGDIVDENYDSTYEYEKGVLEIPSNTAVEFADDNNVVIYDTSYSIKKGDTIVVYSNGVPLVYDAQEVTVNSDNITVKVTDTTNENAVEDVDMQTVFDVDANDFIPAEGYEIVDEPTTFSTRGKAKDIINSIKLSRKFDLPAGNSINIEIQISDIILSDKINTADKSLTVRADFNLSVKINGQFNFTDIGKDDLDDLNNLGSIPIAGVGYFDFKPELNFNGKVGYEQNYKITLGFTKDNSGLHNISKFNKEKFTFVFEASCKFGIKVEIGLKILTAKVGVYAEIGAIATSTAEVSEDANNVSTYCLTLSAYMYVNLGAEYNINIGFWKDNGKKEWQIYKKSNSPVRLYFHFENGKSVNACTVDSKTKTKYVTPGDSKYGSVYGDGIISSSIIIADDFTISTYFDGTAAITDYTGTASVLNIPEYIKGYKITSIGHQAFYGCASLTSITIPNSVTGIGVNAFCDCKSLTSVTIGNGVTSIGDDAFSYCDSLTSIDVDSQNQYYASQNGVLYNKDKTRLIRYPVGNTRTAYTIPNSVISIGDHAFSYCDSLTSITIPDSVMSIGNYVFRDCNNLTSVTIGNSVKSIGQTAFYHCTSLTSITIPDSVTSIGSWAFTHCTSLTSVTIGNSVTNIGEHAFCNCSSLANVTIGNGVTSIGYRAFDRCSSLASITIPNSVTSIGEEAFCNCNNLTSVTIGNSVTSIGISAFRHCDSLTSVTIPDSVISIENSAFRYCDSLTSVTIGNGVTSIGNYAFSDCGSLTSVTIGNGVTSIGEYAFYSCDSLTSVTIPDSVISVEDSAFYCCNSLTSVTIGNSLTSIGSRAFSQCISLTSIDVDSQNQYYASQDGVLFNKDKTKLIQYPIGNTRTAYTIPNSVTSIGEWAFKYCNSLTSVTISDSVTSIGGSAFSGCKSLTSVTIGNSVTSIGISAFRYCDSLTSIDVDSQNQYYASQDGVLFNKDKTELIQYPTGNTRTSYTIPNSVTSIGDDAFNYCYSLTSVTIGNSVTSIGNYAFSGCSSLTNVYYNGTEEQWKNISTGSDNSYLTNANIHYSSTEENHKYELTQTVEATCYNDGYNKYVCPCGFEKTEIINKLEHNYVDGVCQNCGDTRAVISIKDNTKTVDIINGGEYQYLMFVPETSGNYVLYSTGTDDTYGYLYDADMNEITSNDDGDEGNNFSLTYELEANKTYYYGVRFFNSSKTGSITVVLEQACSHNYVSTVHAPTCTESGYTEYVCEKCGDNYESDYVDALGHNYVNDICTICGKVNSDYEYTVLDDGTAQINKYTGNATELEIPSEINGYQVTSIGDRAFYGCTSLASITIPDSVTSIGNYAFCDCESLSSISIPDSVTSIGDCVFYECRSLTNVSIPSGVTSIGSSAFRGCTSLASITIPDSVTIIWNCAFSDCTSLTSIIIPNSVMSIGEYAFSDCSNLEKIVIRSNNCDIADSEYTISEQTVIYGYPGSTAQAYAEKYNRQFVALDDSEHTHSFVSESIPATCTQQGYTTYTCECGETKTETIPATGHTAVIDNAVPATCTTAGLAEGSHCSVCGYVITAQEVVNATGHNYKSVITKEATCTATGVKTIACTVCGDSYTETIDMLDHTPATDVAVAPTCTKAGLTEGSHCSVCGCVITAQEVVNAIGHIWNDGKVTTEATCTATGVMTYTCTVCGTTDSETIAKKTHIYKEYTTKATTKKNGSVVIKCTVCSAVKSKSTVYYPKTIKLSKTSYTYNGKVQTPSVTVNDSMGKTLKKNTDYTVTYAKGRKNVGKYSVKITFKGKYSGSKTLYYTIKPKATSISKLTAGKKKFTVKWKKLTTQTTGYQIQYSTSSKFKSAKTVTVSKNKTTSKTISKLKAKKKYYVRIRTYKTVGKTKYYSSWSKAKAVTTKDKTF